MRGTLRALWTLFAVTINGTDVRRHVFTSSGPLQSSSEHAERLEAARYAGVSAEVFLGLPGTRFWGEIEHAAISQAELIASYRTQKLVTAVTNDLQIREMKRKRGRS